ncbi:MAG: VWA domain-containing protein [Haloarculaceae archaeon]
MAAEVAIGGARAGVERPLVLLAVPVAVALVAWLVLRPFADVPITRRRLALFGSRVLLVTLLIVAAAGPYTAAERETIGDPQIRLLVDRSDSTAVQDDASDRLATAIEDQDVPVETTTIASGASSPLGERIAAALQPGGTVVVVSDGRVTDGQSLAEVAELARSVDATVSVVNATATTTERYVTVNGPAKTSVGVENTFLTSVGGVELGTSSTNLTVSVDGDVVETTTVSGRGRLAVAHTFEETGTHRVTARVGGDDRFDRNDVFRKTVRVVPKPRVLYVTRGTYPLADFLDQLYDVERREQVPSDLAGYYAVVVQNVPAARLGDVNALQRAVVNGTGLVVVGGPDAYDHGGYSNSTLGDMLPVRQGESDDAATVVLAVDVSGSAKSGMSVQKRLALDVLNQLGDRNRVGLVAFNHRAFRVADPEPLAESRSTLRDRIRRLQSGGGTRIDRGLEGAGTMVGEGGTVILVSDGRDRNGDAVLAARTLATQGTRVIAVGVGSSVNERALRNVADAGEGTYLRANQASRLRILFGGESRQYSGDRLTVVDGDHFVTRGVEFSANPGVGHDVSVKERASYLVATASGEPALAAWHYGLGRVVSVTTYAPDGTLDGLLSSPDSLAMTKSVNWAIGDPQRLADGVTDVADTRVGVPTTVTYAGRERPTVEGVRFVRTGEGTYRATVVPSEAGYHAVGDATYAANYPPEYGAFGQSTALRRLAVTTGGRVFEPNQAAAIATFARQRSRAVREVETDWTWPALALAVAIYLLEVSVRRVRELYALQEHHHT